MVKILSDSTSDLSEELKERYDIDIIPLHILLGEEEFEDGLGITPEEIFKWSDEHETTPKTSAAGVERVTEILSKYSEYDDIIVFVISEEMSSTGTVCRLAAQELGIESKVHVVDSKNLSTGIGLLIVKAAELAKEGMECEEILKEIEKTIPMVRASFVVDTLVYLYRGGRCSGLAAMAGAVLKLHPRINVIDGKMLPGKKYRGKLERVILDYEQDLKNDLMNAEEGHVFITHSGCDDAIVEKVRTVLAGLGHFKEIHITRAGGVISSHCGPGTLGVLFISKG